MIWAKNPDGEFEFTDQATADSWAEYQSDYSNIKNPAALGSGDFSGATEYAGTDYYGNPAALTSHDLVPGISDPFAANTPEDVKAQILSERASEEESRGFFGDLASSAKDGVSFVGEDVVDRGILQPLFGPDSDIGKGINQAGDYIEEKGGQLVGAAADYIGKTEGDAQSQAFEAYWPYKEQQLQGAQAAFGSQDPLNPAFSQSSQDYLSGTRERALGGSDILGQAQGRLSGLFGQGDPSRGLYDQFASGQLGQADPSQGFFQNQQALGANRAFDQLGRTSRGDLLQSNPYLDQIYNRGAGKLTEGFEGAMDKINASYNLQGGFGSSARRDDLTDRAGDLTESLGGLYSDIYGGDYQRERDRQLSATGTLGDLSDASLGRQMQGAGAASDIYGQGLSRQLQGGQLGSQAYGRDFQNTLSTIDPSFRFANQDYTDLAQLGQAGQTQDIFNRQQAMEPWQKVDLYGSAIGGTPSGAGTPQQGSNPLMGALGGAAAGSALGPWGALGGGLLGFFGSS